jgi:ABC-type transport system involved in multi-copper enzyme maturation permease subunit
MRIWGMFRFTLGETLRKGTLIFYCSVATIIIILFALIVNISAISPNGVTEPRLVEFVLLGLFHQSVGAIILFGIFGVAGLIPSMLKKGTIDLFLSKPLSRSELLLSRALGASAGIAVNIVYFFVGIWIVLGLKVGIWHTGFLESSILVAFAYACLYSIVALFGVLTRSTGYSVLFGFIFYFLSAGLEAREQSFYLLWDNAVFHRFLDACSYLTPQLSAMIRNAALIVGQSAVMPESGSFSWMPFLYSFLSASLFYALSIWYFSRRDY